MDVNIETKDNKTDEKDTGDKCENGTDKLEHSEKPLCVQSKSESLKDDSHDRIISSPKLQNDMLAKAEDMCHKEAKINEVIANNEDIPEVDQGLNDCTTETEKGERLEMVTDDTTKSQLLSEQTSSLSSNLQQISDISASRGMNDETLPSQIEISIENVDGSGLGKQFTELRNGDDGSDMTSDSESDSESSSSSSSDSSDEDEGKTNDKLERVLPDAIGDDDSDKGKKLNKLGLEDIRTKGELFPEELPPVENLQLNVSDGVELRQIGNITSIVGILVVIQSNKDVPPLHEETFLFHNKRAIGQIFEVFGPVSTPWYSVRFNSLEEITDHGLKVGNPVCYAPKDTNFTNYVFVEDLKRIKGSDASWENNNEPPSKYLEFSDDEEERRAKAKKRGKGDNIVKMEEEEGSQLPGARKYQKRQRHKINRQNEGLNESSPCRNGVQDQRTGKRPAGYGMNSSEGRAHGRNFGQNNMQHFHGNQRPMSFNFNNQNSTSVPQRPWRNNQPHKNFSNWNGPPQRFQKFRPRSQNSSFHRMPSNISSSHDHNSGFNRMQMNIPPSRYQNVASNRMSMNIQSSQNCTFNRMPTNMQYSDNSSFNRMGLNVPSSQNGSVSRMQMSLQDSHGMQPPSNSSSNFSRHHQYSYDGQSGYECYNNENDTWNCSGMNFSASDPRSSINDNNQQMPYFQSPIIDTRLVNNAEAQESMFQNYTPNTGYFDYKNPAIEPSDSGPIYNQNLHPHFESS